MTLAFLPLLCLSSSYAFAVRAGRRAGVEAPRREGLLFACLLCSALAAGISELLSLPRALTSTWVAVSWSAAAGLMACAAWLAKGRRVESAQDRDGRPVLARTDLLLLFEVALVLAVLLVIAVASPPVTWDTLNYHLPRIVHWIQNQGLIHFPTHYTAQLFHPPLAELIDLQFIILGGSDFCVSLVRIFFIVGTLVGVSLVVKQLGAGTRGQVAGAVAAATIPTVILQGTSGKNSIVAAFFLVCMVHYLLSMRNRLAFGRELAAATALGLALLTKVTVSLFAFPFLVWFGAALLGRYRARAWRPLVLLAVVPLALNAGHWCRNYEVFGHPMSDPTFDEVLGVEQPVTVPQLISNAIRSATLQLNTPSETLNQYMESAVVAAHRLLGVAPEDPAITTPSAAYEVFETNLDDGMASSPFHFILLVVSSVLVLTQRRLRSNRSLLAYTVALSAAALMGPAFLKWSPILGRLYLPLLVLGTPVAAIALTELPSRAWSTALFTGLVLSSGPWLLYGWPRPLLGPESVLHSSRDELYLRLVSPQLRRSIPQAAAWIREQGFQQIGFHSQGYEYQFWLMLDSPHVSPRLQDVDVGPRGAMVAGDPFDAFRPDVVVRIHNTNSRFEKRLDFGGVVYSQALVLPRLVLYAPRP